MDREKFIVMVREFPFLGKIFQSGSLDYQHFESITVKCVDENLLSVTPSAQTRDSDALGGRNYRRSFWRVSGNGKFKKLQEAYYHSRWGASNELKRPAQSIGAQLLADNKDVSFIVEINDDPDNREYVLPPGAKQYVHRSETRCVVLYKMKDFDWRGCPVVLHWRL